MRAKESVEGGDPERPEFKAVENSESPRLEEVLISRVYSYLAGRKEAGLLQIAKELDLKVPTVMKVLSELSRRGKVKRIV